ncbi:Alpha/beta hydrolase family-domain-containing protein [Rhodocollybia butyracea]|uniref:Alpha/beta hydrolase family-domain-containing protein n=1 Tax=Rhodocollybia butyracea TaxID=206335 RepID=A0A9P5Q1A3_9AGAR|nr:Alpha/beta hydrolase family-domain-containing protein [Rhodocollybia butyracea]
MVSLDISSFTYETRASGLLLWNSAKRYRPKFQDTTAEEANSATSSNANDNGARDRRKLDSEGMVLLMAHGTGYHKEHWEPTIEHLFDLEFTTASASSSPNPKSAIHIRECWAVDVQNHGEAAVLNEKITREKPEVWSIWDYADAFATLRRDILGADASYQDNKFVLVAHSASATAAVLATTYFPVPTIPEIFHSLIFIEPATIPDPSFVDPAKHTPLFRSVGQLMLKRKDTWPSKEAAKEWMSEKLPWGMWDERVLNAYVEFGLGTVSGDKEGAVTLRCTREIESLIYNRGVRQGLPGLWQLNLLCNVNAHLGDSRLSGLDKDVKKAKPGVGKPILPIHVVWGEIDDMFSSEVKDGLEDPAQGRVFTSVRRVEDVGHMMVQTSPQATAKALWDIFVESVDEFQEVKSKL